MKFSVSSDTSLQMVGGGNKKQGTYSSVYLMTNRGRKLCNCSRSMVRPEAAKRSDLARLREDDDPCGSVPPLKVTIASDSIPATGTYRCTRSQVAPGEHFYYQYTHQVAADRYDLIIPPLTLNCSQQTQLSINCYSFLFKNNQVIGISSFPTQPGTKSNWLTIGGTAIDTYFSPFTVSYSQVSN